MCVCSCASTCHSMQAEVRNQLVEANSLLSLCNFQSLNLGSHLGNKSLDLLSHLTSSHTF